MTNCDDLLQTEKVKVKNCENSYVNSTRFLFGSCSQLSYITPQLRNRLKLKTVGTQKTSIQTFENNCSENILEKVNLRILALDGLEICVTCFVKEICAPLSNQNINLAKEGFAHIKNILLLDSNPNNESLSVDVLIGVDYHWSIINKQVIKSKEGPIPLDTKVGWMLSGPVGNAFASVNKSVLLSHVMEVQSKFMDASNVLKQDLHKGWFDLKETNTDSESDCFDFKRFQKENTTFNENASSYEVGLLFKEYHEILSDNYFNCKKRFNSLSKRFERNNELLQEYNNIIKEQLKLDVVEKVPPSETNTFDQVENIHYLPRRSVIKDDGVTSKVRIVFDASSKIKGPSLNDCLHPVPFFLFLK